MRSTTRATAGTASATMGRSRACTTWSWTCPRGREAGMAESWAAPLPGGWGWDEAAFRAAAHRVADMAADHLAGLRDRPVLDPVPVPVAERWRQADWPAGGVALDELLAELERDVLSHPLGNGHP